MDLDRVTAALADRYEKLEKIGEGGMGVVYRARQRGLGRAVAIKIATAPAPEDRARFRAEAQALARLDHPGIVSLYEADLEGDTPWFAMPLVEGRSLADRIVDGRMPPARVLAIAAQVAAALAHAHAHGIVHRDVKPENILVTDGGEARLADFGIARWTAGRPDGMPATAPGTVLGSPHYMAPEQVQGKVGPATDVYGLGATLYEALTGRPPFPYGDVLAILNGHLREPVPGLPGAPAPVEDLVRSMLDKDPARRPVDGAALVRAVARAQQELERASRKTRVVAPASTLSSWWIVFAFFGGVALTAAALRPPAPEPTPSATAALEPADTRSIEERARDRLALYLRDLELPITIKVTNTAWAEVLPVERADAEAASMGSLLEPSHAGRPVQALFDSPACQQHCLNPQNVEFVIPPPPSGGWVMELALKGASPDTLAMFALNFERPRPVKPSAGEGDILLFRTVVNPRPARNVGTWLVVNPARKHVWLHQLSARPVGVPPVPPPEKHPEPRYTGDLATLAADARAAFDRRDDRAVDLLGELIAREPAAEQPRAQLGEALHRARRLADAVDAFDVYLRDRPAAAWAWSDLSVTLLDMGRLREARSIALHALRLAPTRFWFWVNLGRIDWAAGDTARAVDHVRFAIQCEPRNPDGPRELARMNALR